jgi:hypothetical protein
MTMTCRADFHDGKMAVVSQREITEERFLEQFAALEDGLALLQLQMRGMSENAKLFGSFVRHLRQATFPAARDPHQAAIELDSGFPTAAEIVQSKASYRHAK